VIQINTYEAKKNLSSLLKKVEKGEVVIISSHNKPVAELRPISKKPLKPRPMGLCKGEFEVPENFNDPLPDEILETFYPKT